MNRLLKYFFLYLIFIVPNITSAKEFVPPLAKNNDFQAKFISQSVKDPIIINTGDTKIVIVRIKNTGKSTWKAKGNNYVSVYTVDPNYHDSKFSSSYWLEKNQPVKITKDVKSGEIAEFKIVLAAPTKAGEYTERFSLAVENKSWIKGGYFYFKISVKNTVVNVKKTVVKQNNDSRVSSTITINTTTVGSEVTPVISQSTSSDYSEVSSSPRELISEPVIRVGLYKADKTVEFVSDSDYQIFLGTVSVNTLPAGQKAKLSYKKGVYQLSTEDFVVTSTDYLRLVPSDITNFFTLVNFDRPVSWKDNKNFNTYRGVMEYKYSAKSDTVYVINELPLDLYVAGIGETSDGAPIEYIKAILVAARTYAYYHINNGLPADKRTFDVLATTADQLYLGYNPEAPMPRIAQAASDTYGQMVTYDKKVVVTPYFGNSNGRTKTWKEVWGGENKPYLQPVECVYDKGKKIWGHGVGMSTADAVQRAAHDGWTYDQILKYYYTGVEIEKIY